MRKFFVALAMLGMVATSLAPNAQSAVQAQDENFCESLSFIEYGDDVAGEITDTTTFEAYCFTGEAGDEISIAVEATSGDLDTVVRLLDPSATELFAENDDVEEGNTDSLLEFELPEDGDYLIFISRYQFEDGDTTGDFTMSLSSGSGGKPSGDKDDDKGDATPDAQTPVDPSEAVILSCDTGETLYGGLQFGFVNIVPGYSYTVTVFGLDDFDPVVAVETARGVGTCSDDERNTVGSFVAIPGEGSVAANRNTAQVRFSLPRAGSPIITVGSFDGQYGRFAMVIEGLAITPSTELDGFIIRVPSSLTAEPFSVYMISRYADLDPYLQIFAGDGLDDAFDTDGTFEPEFIDYNDLALIAVCDDAGGGDCSETPALPGGGVNIANGRAYITGQYDAGILGVPETTEPFLFAFGSFNGQTSGEYAIVIIGSVPAVDID